MLGSLLDKLGSFFSKTFVVGAVPLLAFLFFNGVMAYRVSSHFQRLVLLYVFAPDNARTAVLSFALLLMVVVLSYVFSTLSVSLREALEGKYLGATLSDALSQRYQERMEKVEQKLYEARRNRRSIRENEEAWRNAMGEAYQHGKTLGPVCTYNRRDELDRLFDRSAGNQNITSQQLRAEVEAMTVTLRTNNPELENTQSEKLDGDHSALLRLIDYAANKWDKQYVEYLNKYQMDYGGKDVAPTKMGNVSKAAPYYAASRYSMNLDIFWSRLQKVLQGDSNFYALLQDAKTQLDFLVALVWVTLAFTIIWVILLPCLGEAKAAFVLIAIGGPVLTYVWYILAIQNYRSFSDLLRTSIDLYRLDLLKMLSVPLPSNAEEERMLWEMLERRFVYGEYPNMVFKKA